MKYIFIAIYIILNCYGCTSSQSPQIETQNIQDSILTISNTQNIQIGALRFDLYLHLLRDKKVGVVVNQTSILDTVHLIDVLLGHNIDVSTIFAPEHGFRGTADAGEQIMNGVDSKTGIPIISLYGNNKKPSAQMLDSLDILVFDIQDVGVRFFTYISTMHYVMESCAINDKPLIILDRPNPNGDYIDGPILKPLFRSFVGMHPIPVVHGLTIGELALMIQGEKWLTDTTLRCQLSVIPVANYKHDSPYLLPVKPSPNLPNYLSVRLYPSLCFFEATQISIGRGTYMPFQIIGYPNKAFGNYTFTPISIDGMAKNPLHQDQICYGINLQNEDTTHTFTLKYLLQFYQLHTQAKIGSAFFSRPDWINLLAGTDQLQKQILSGMSEEEIRETWQDDLQKYRTIRQKYLLYP